VTFTSPIKLSGEGPINVVVVPGFAVECRKLLGRASFARLSHAYRSYARVVTFDSAAPEMSDCGRGASRSRSAHGRPARGDGRRRHGQASLFGISEGAPLSVLFAANLSRPLRALALYGSFFALLVLVPAEEALQAFFGYVAQHGAPAQRATIAPSRRRRRRLSAHGGDATSGLAPPGCRDQLIAQEQPRSTSAPFFGGSCADTRDSPHRDKAVMWGGRARRGGEEFLGSTRRALRRRRRNCRRSSRHCVERRLPPTFYRSFARVSTEPGRGPRWADLPTSNFVRRNRTFSRGSERHATGSRQSVRSRRVAFAAACA